MFQLMSVIHNFPAILRECFCWWPRAASAGGIPPLRQEHSQAERSSWRRAPREVGSSVAGTGKGVLSWARGNTGNVSRDPRPAAVFNLHLSRTLLLLEAWVLVTMQRSPLQVQFKIERNSAACGTAKCSLISVYRNGKLEAIPGGSKGWRNARRADCRPASVPWVCYTSPPKAPLTQSFS